MKLLELTIGNKLNFGIYINNICKVASTKIKGLGRIGCLVWMFCSKALQNKINKIQKRALRTVYSEPNLNLDKPVELDKGTTIHIKNIITLPTEV